MTVTLLHKRSSTPGDIPTAGQLMPGELAINSADGILYTEKADGSVAAFLPTMGKNRIINGDFRIAQRGTSVACPVGALTYTADRWLVGVTGAATVVGIASEAAPPFNYLISAGVAGQTGLSFRQRIERGNIRDLAGKQVTLSFNFYTAGGTYAKSIIIYRANAENDFSAVTQIFSATPADTTARQSVTFTLPAEAANGVEVMFLVNNLNNSGHAAVLFEVQLEEGPVATPFERRPVGLELMMCQRYYQVALGLASMYASAGGIGCRGMFSFEVAMRITPTLLNAGAIVSINAGAPTLDSANIYGGRITVVSAAAGFMEHYGLIVGSAEL